MLSSPRKRPRRRPPGLHVALVVVVLCTGLALRAANLGGPTFGFDELYHVLAAKGLLAGEGFHLPSGRVYGRAELVTLLTAGAFALFGESEATARLPALAFGALTLGLIYLAGRRLFGPTAGLVALLLLALSPEAIDIDRFARLYSPLAFFVLLGALAAFVALEGDGGEDSGPVAPARRQLLGDPAVARRAGWLAVATAAGLAALHLHPVAFGLVAVVQAYAAIMAGGLLLQARYRPAAGYAGVALVILAVEGLAAAAAPGLRAGLVDAALIPLSWYRPTPGDVMFYHYHLAGEYAWLWYLVWPAAVAVAVGYPRAGLFVGLAFWLPFVVLSAVVATKAPRYLVHLLPFAWLLLGGAAGLLWPPARAGLLARLQPLLPARLPVAAAAAAVAALAAAPVLRLTPSVVTAFRRPTQSTGAFTTGHFADWRLLAEALRPRLTPEARLVASVPLAARYYLGRPAHHLIGPDRPREHRERGSAVGAGDDRVQRDGDLAVLRASGTPVWVVVERWRWETPGKLDARLKEALARGCTPAPVPSRAGLLAFGCAPLDDAAGALKSRPAPGPERNGRDRPRSAGAPPGDSPR